MSTSVFILHQVLLEHVFFDIFIIKLVNGCHAIIGSHLWKTLKTKR